MTTAMQRMDFEAGIQSLTEAYREATDQLVVEDPAMNQRVLDLIQIWWDVLSDDFKFAETHVDPVLPDPKSVESHQQAIEHLALAVRQCDSRNILLWSEGVFGTLRTYLRKVERAAADRAARVRGTEGDSGPHVVATQNERRTASLLVDRLEQALLSHRLRMNTQLAEKAVREAQKAAEDARNAAGFASEAELTVQFEDLATTESQTAKSFRTWTIVTVVAGVVLSFFLGPNDDAEVGQALFRIALLAGVLGLATYLGRQAAHHRNLSAWANTIKVQLLTFDGYVAPVKDDKLRDDMRVAFATRVFGSSPESKDESGPTLSASANDLIAQFARSGPRA